MTVATVQVTIKVLRKNDISVPEYLFCVVPNVGGNKKKKITASSFSHPSVLFSVEIIPKNRSATKEK
jgi:hypothetical protein